jgi:hypothetical protein
MSAVIHYKCNNQECDFKTIREAHFPIWKSDSPKEWRKLPVGIRNEKFVAGYVNRQYCITCKTLQPYLEGSNMCLICQKEDLFIKDGSICPKCNTGIINEVEGMNILF